MPSFSSTKHLLSCLPLAISILSLLASCSDGSKKPLLVHSKGQPSEVLVVMGEDMWSGSLGDTVRSVLTGDVMGLPQPEPCFRMLHISPDCFTRNFRSISNILQVTIDPKLKKATVGLAYDVYAQPQILVRLSAPSGIAAAEHLSQHGLQVLDLFLDAELSREAAQLSKTHSKTVLQSVQRQFHYHANVPSDIRYVKHGDHFLWASNTIVDNSLNFCIYTLPNISANSLNEKRMVSIRDSVMKCNVPGSEPDQWMATDSRSTMSRSRIINGRLTFELRGLWEMEHAAMGGPFVCYAFDDQARGVLVVAEGFVFAPGKEKRNAMRRLEASLRTIAP